MSKATLMSINPRWCELIARGEKTIEVRKTYPVDLTPPFKVYILLCLKMWFVDGNWSMVAMYVAWIVNCIYGWYTWTRLNKRPPEEVE